MGVRLQKVLAQAGIASRRTSEEMVRAGRVRVNGRTATVGMVVDPVADQIEVDGLRLGAAESLAYIMLNKPRGVLSSLHSQGGKTTVRDLIPIELRLYPVGRLDLLSEGLQLMTNDGPLAQRLTHPRFGHEKTYRVLLDHRPTASQLDAWRRGMTLDDGTPFGPAEVRPWIAPGEDRWVEVILREGKNRQVRRTAEALGLRVRRLIRIGFAGLELGDLPEGKWRPLEAREVQLLAAGRSARSVRGGRGPRPKKPRAEKVESI